MNVLLDECVDVRLGSYIVGHHVSTISQMGWNAVSDSILLANSQLSFDVLITIDQNLEFQQNLKKFDIAVVVLDGDSNRLSDLLDIVPSLLAALPFVPKSAATHIGS